MISHSPSFYQGERAIFLNAPHHSFPFSLPDPYLNNRLRPNSGYDQHNPGLKCLLLFTENRNRKPQTGRPRGLPLVAIIGRANVGKSTLFNRLTRSSQALVADFSGVTRDRHYGSVTFDDRTFLLVDTGGLVGGEDEMSTLVRRQAEEAVAEADVILLVTDGREGPQEGDALVVDYLRRTGKTLLLAVNKIDHPGLEAKAADFYRFGLDPVYPVSATQGYGLNDPAGGHSPAPAPPSGTARPGPGHPGGGPGPSQCGQVLLHQPLPGRGTPPGERHPRAPPGTPSTPP